MKGRLKLLGVILASGLLLAFLLVGIAYAARIVVDSFDAGEQNLVANPVTTTVSGTVSSASAVLGTERDAQVDWVSGIGNVSLRIDQFGLSDQLKFSEDSGVQGSAQVVWDGTDGDPATLDDVGLGGVDLTDAGANDGFQLIIYEADSGYNLVVSVYSATTVASYTLNLGTSVSPPGFSFFMPFANFDGDTGVFSSVGAVTFDILPPGANVDLTVDLLETTAETDYGDLPADYNLTLDADNGAYHTVGDLYLGSSIDLEADGAESASADGDDGADLDDEDGVTRDMTVNWEPSNTVSLTVQVNGDGGYLVGWFDWNNDNDMDDSGEQVALGSVSNGTNTVTLVVPAAFDTPSSVNELFARFRLYDGVPTTPVPSGSATNGEVEDYRWEFGPNAVTLSSAEAQSASASVLVVALLALGATSAFVLARRLRKA